MVKMYIMGNYTEKAFQGFLKDPNSDRKAVVEKLVKWNITHYGYCKRLIRFLCSCRSS